MLIGGKYVPVTSTVNDYMNCFEWISQFTFAEGSTVIHTFVIVFVDGAEVGVVVVAQRVSSIPTVVGKEELVAVELITHSEKAILGIACLSFPVLHWKNVYDLQRNSHRT